MKHVKRNPTFTQYSIYLSPHYKDNQEENYCGNEDFLASVQVLTYMSLSEVLILSFGAKLI